MTRYREVAVVCHQCGVTFAAGAGRGARFCSGRCRVAAHRRTLKAVPEVRHDPDPKPEGDDAGGFRVTRSGVLWRS